MPTIHVHALIDSLTWGGAEMLLSDLAAAAPSAGLRLSVGFLDDRHGAPAATRLRARGVDPELVRVTGLLRPSSLRSVRRHVASVRPDVVHTHLGYSDLLGGIAARSLGIPVVSTIHVMDWSEADLREKVKLRLMGFARRRSAYRVLTVSDAARVAFLRQSWEQPERVITVRNGVAVEAAAGAGRRVRADLGLADDDVVVAMLTVLRRGKGHDAAVAAVAALREKHPRLRLLVLGDGPDRPEIERLAAPLQDAVLMPGHTDDVMAVLDAVDVLVHPTRADALPTAVMEAMAAGVPVVATRVGGVPEVVEHGRSGLLLDPPVTGERLAEALAPVIADPALRRRLGEGGRRRFEQEFSAHRWAERLRAIYELALADLHLGGPGGVRLEEREGGG